MQRTRSSSTTKYKIPEIEGMRALAITLVLLFHFFARWTPPLHSQNVYPYKIEIARRVSEFGYLGVQLFFMISGFVILRSLENQANFATFVRARIYRIFPTLWFAIPLIYFACNKLNQKFIAPIPASSIIPSLTLLDPAFLNRLFSTQLIWTTGVLWSLCIEIQFYLVAGTIFFKLKKYTFVTRLFVIAISMQSVETLIVLANPNVIHIYDALIPLHNYIWWFLAGSTFYRILKSKKSGFLHVLVVISLCINLLSANYESSKFKLSPSPSITTVIFYLIFYAITKWPGKIPILRSSFLVWLGGISYEFYLIHEPLGISALSKIREMESVPNNLLLQLLVVMMITVVLIILSLLLKIISAKSLALFDKFFTTRLRP